jgi:hypothetical protein
MSWSPKLFSGSGPVGLPLVPWNKKKQLKGRHFSSNTKVITFGLGEKWRPLIIIAVAETGWDGQYSGFFFSGLQKLEHRAK